jgi:hypothetical protein
VFEYYCDSADQTTHVNTIFVTADGVSSGNPANDADQSSVVLQSPVPLIEIIKNDNNPNDTDPTLDTQEILNGS